MSFPSPSSWGTQVSMFGAAASWLPKNPAAATPFPHYLGTRSSQIAFAADINEWPVAASGKPCNPRVSAMGQLHDRDRVGVLHPA